MVGGSRFRVTPAATPEQPEIKQLQNALLVPPPLPNVSSDQHLPKDTHQVSGLSRPAISRLKSTSHRRCQRSRWVPRQQPRGSHN
eukprot:COSAG06_NODE_931_length_11460_cov_4.121644_2_plen_85_part_00